MTHSSLGFIGGGRVTRVLLGGLERAGRRVKGTHVTEPDERAADVLKSLYPDVVVSGADCRLAAAQDVVFGALHPPTLRNVLPEVSRHLRAEAMFVSLAPALDLEELRSGLGGFQRVARMIPNAPSIVGKGFNPVAFSTGVPAAAQCELLDLLGALGECPVVEEHLLEAYAIVSGMGPTYLWFQLQELAELGASFGLSPEAANRAVLKTAEGAAALLFSGDLPFGEVRDLVPVHPLANSEDEIRNLFRKALGGLFEKLSRRPEASGGERSRALRPQRSTGSVVRD